MKKCCYQIENLQSYGATGKQVTPHAGLLLIRYQAYMRCRICKGKLKSDVTKSIYSRAKVKAKGARRREAA